MAVTSSTTEDSSSPFSKYLSEEASKGTIHRLLFRSPRLGTLFGLKQTQSLDDEEDTIYLGKMILMAANKGDLETIQTCIEQGGSITYVNTALEGAAFFAATKGLAFLRQVHQLGAPLSLVTKNGQSITHQLARFPEVEAFRYACANGAVIGQLTWNGQTELHLAASAGNVAVLAFLLDKASQPTKAQRVDTLAVDYTSTAGSSALHYAVRAGYLECVAALLQAGADPNKKTYEWSNSGDVALHLAAKRKHKAIINALLKGGANFSGCKSCSKGKACSRIDPKWAEYVRKKMNST